MKYCVLTIKFDKRGRQINKVHQFDTEDEANEFEMKLPKNLSRQRYISETSLNKKGMAVG